MNNPTKRIYWTQEERKILAVEIARLLNEDPILSLLEATLEAQTLILPENKRREISTVGTMPWLKNAVREELVVLRSKHDNLVREELNAAQALNKEYEEKLRDLENMVSHIDPLQAIEIVARSMSPADAAMHIARITTDHLILEQLSAQQMLEMKPVTNTKRTRKLRVLVAGLLPGQIRLIEEKFCQALDIKFWQTSESITKLKSSLSSNTDKVVVLTKFVSHKTTEITAAYDHILVNGGLSSLKETLLGLTDV